MWAISQHSDQHSRFVAAGKVEAVDGTKVDASGKPQTTQTCTITIDYELVLSCVDFARVCTFCGFLITSEVMLVQGARYELMTAEPEDLGFETSYFYLIT